MLRRPVNIVHIENPVEINSSLYSLRGDILRRLRDNSSARTHLFPPVQVKPSSTTFMKTPSCDSYGIAVVFFFVLTIFNRNPVAMSTLKNRNASQVVVNGEIVLDMSNSRFLHDLKNFFCNT